MNNKNLQANAEESVSDSDFNLTVDSLDSDQWCELFEFGERIIVGSFGVYLPSKWFTHPGIATEVLSLCLEYIACHEMNRPLTTWLTHLENLARHCMAPHLGSTSDACVPLDDRELLFVSGHLFGASLKQWQPESRTSIRSFRDYLFKKQRSHVPPRPLYLNELTKLAEPTKKAPKTHDPGSI